MKILHTADIHLKKYNDARWQAFINIIKISAAEKIDLLIIAGDFLDKNIAGALRENIRGLFKKTDFHTYILPGNHDELILKEPGLYWGENVTILQKFQSLPIDNVLFHILPFSDYSEADLRAAIEKIKLDSNKINILLYHGELQDIIRSKEDFGDESGKNYMPARLAFFNGFDYVLAGHFHTKFRIERIGEHGYFVYPGSPVSITKKEVGIRKVNIFKTGQAPTEYELPNNFFYSKIKIELNPDSTQRSFDKQLKAAKSKIPDNCMPLIYVKGFYNKNLLRMSESEVAEKIKAEFGDYESFKSLEVSKILDDEIYKSFISKLEKASSSKSDQKSMKELLFEVLKEAVYEN